MAEQRASRKTDRNRNGCRVALVDFRPRASSTIAPKAGSARAVGTHCRRRAPAPPLHRERESVVVVHTHAPRRNRAPAGAGAPPAAPAAVAERRAAGRLSLPICRFRRPPSAAPPSASNIEPSCPPIAAPRVRWPRRRRPPTPSRTRLCPQRRLLPMQRRLLPMQRRLLPPVHAQSASRKEANSCGHATAPRAQNWLAPTRFASHAGRKYSTKASTKRAPSAAETWGCGCLTTSRCT